MFQISCSKDANAGNSGGSGIMSQGKMITIKSISPPTLQIVSNDGTKKDLNLTLPNGLTTLHDQYIACDGTTIWLVANSFNISFTNNNNTLITCDMNGGNIKNLGSYNVYGDCFVAY